MKRILIVVLALASASWPCGTERWQVKVLRDSAAAHINFTPEARPLHELIAILPPNSLRTAGEHVRFEPELHVYAVDALLIGYKREADGDYHLVIADPVDRKKTMVAEIPDTACAPRQYATRFQAAAGFIERLGHATAKFKTLPKPLPVVVTGVFFFDYIHGQQGVAPNGAELHPVFSVIAKSKAVARKGR